MASLAFEAVTRVFPNGDRAVDRVDLRVEAGEYLAILGPSGAGKTTLLRLVAGLEAPTSGVVRADGRSLAGVAPGRRGVAMMFQEDALYPHLSVEANLGFALRSGGVPRARRRARVLEVARRLGIEDRLDRRPRSLSAGERQRVALGRALVRRPRILLLDEPLARLDAHLRSRARSELHRHHREGGSTTLHVTHDQEEALSLGDRVAVLQGGRLLQVDRPGVVYSRPAIRSVAEFIGQPGMGFLDGVVYGPPDGPRLRGEGFDLELPPALRRGAERLRGKSAAIGIRAEDIRPSFREEGRAGSGRAGEARLRVRVERLELVGAHLLVHLEAPGATGLVARAGCRAAPRAGDPVTIRLDLERACLFDGTGEGRLVAGGEA